MKDPTFVVIPALLIALIYFMGRMFLYEKARNNKSDIGETEKGISPNESFAQKSDYKPKKSVIPYLLMLFGGYLGFVMAPVSYCYGSIGLMAWMICLSILFIFGGWMMR